MSMKIAVIIVLIVALATGIGGAARFAMGQQSEEYEVKVNGRAIKSAEIDHAQDVQGRAAGTTPDRGVVTERLIDFELADQEAQRQGFDCSNAQVDDLLQRPMALGGAVQEKALAFSGLVPAGWADTPEAERTPSRDVLAQQYVSDPRLRSAVREQCRVGQLYGSLGTPDSSGQVPNDARNAAIEDLLGKLRAAADIQRR